jgi:hypothetical protein
MNRKPEAYKQKIDNNRQLNNIYEGYSPAVLTRNGTSPYGKPDC